MGPCGLIDVRYSLNGEVVLRLTLLELAVTASGLVGNVLDGIHFDLLCGSYFVWCCFSVFRQVREVIRFNWVSQTFCGMKKKKGKWQEGVRKEIYFFVWEWGRGSGWYAIEVMSEASRGYGCAAADHSPWA